MSSDFSLNAPDVAIIIGTLIAVVVVGWVASRRAGENAASYFTAAGRMPWYLIGMSFVSTSVSSEQIVGTAGAAYEYGMGVANWEWFSLPVYIPLLALFVPLYLKNRITTVPELLERRFGPLCGDIYSWTMLVAYVVIFLLPVLYGGALAIHSLTGWNFHFVLWGIGILVGIYTIKGGLTSTMWTDSLQCLLLLGGGLVLFVASLYYIPGGWSAMQQAAPERFHLYRPPSDPVAPFLGLLAGSIGVFLFYQATNQVMIQRVLSARSTWDGLMGIIFAGGINFFRPLVTCFIGFVVYHWIHEMHMAPSLEDRDQTFPFALKTFAPAWGLRGIVLSGFLAAVMSTVSGIANAASTIFSFGVYRRLINPQATDDELVRVGRWTVAVALGSACLLAPIVGKFGGIFVYFQTGVTYLATPFISVILVGILWKRANYSGAIAGLAGGLAIVTALGVGLPLSGVHLNWLYVSFIAQVLITLVVIAVSLATAPPDREAVKNYVWRPSLLMHYDEGIKRPAYQSVWLWFALYAVAWVSIYAYFW